MRHSNFLSDNSEILTCSDEKHYVERTTQNIPSGFRGKATIRTSGVEW